MPSGAAVTRAATSCRHAAAPALALPAHEATDPAGGGNVSSHSAVYREKNWLALAGKADAHAAGRSSCRPAVTESSTEPPTSPARTASVCPSGRKLMVSCVDLTSTGSGKIPVTCTVRVSCLHDAICHARMSSMVLSTTPGTPRS